MSHTFPVAPLPGDENPLVDGNYDLEANLETNPVPDPILDPVPNPVPNPDGAQNLNPRYCPCRKAVLNLRTNPGYDDVFVMVQHHLEGLPVSPTGIHRKVYYELIHTEIDFPTPLKSWGCIEETATGVVLDSMQLPTDAVHVRRTSDIFLLRYDNSRRMLLCTAHGVYVICVYLDPNWRGYGGGGHDVDQGDGGEDNGAEGTSRIEAESVNRAEPENEIEGGAKEEIRDVNQTQAVEAGDTDDIAQKVADQCPQS
jgi:hypothetical protein